MKIKKLTLTLLSCFLLTALITGCTSQTAPEQEKTKIRMGVMNSIDILPFVIAQENGYFAEEGIDYELQSFTSAKDRDAALQAGELDAVIADNVASSIYENAGMDMKITGTSTGNWTVVAGKDSGINSVSDIKGKKVGISENTMIDYLAHDLVTQNGMTDADIERVILPAMPMRLEALKNGQIDVAILPAPFDTTAIADGGKEIQKIDNQDIMISTISFSKNFIDKNPEAIKSFYKAYDKAVEELNKSDISKYEDLIIKSVGYSEDIRGNIQLPEFQKNYLPEPQKVQEVYDWSKNTGIITKEINAKDVIVDVGIY